MSIRLRVILDLAFRTELRRKLERQAKMEQLIKNRCIFVTLTTQGQCLRKKNNKMCSKLRSKTLQLCWLQCLFYFQFFIFPFTAVQYERATTQRFYGPWRSYATNVHVSIANAINKSFNCSTFMSLNCQMICFIVFNQ